MSLTQKETRRRYRYVVHEVFTHIDKDRGRWKIESEQRDALQAFAEPHSLPRNCKSQLDNTYIADGSHDGSSLWKLLIEVMRTYCIDEANKSSARPLDFAFERGSSSIRPEYWNECVESFGEYLHILADSRQNSNLEQTVNPGPASSSNPSQIEQHSWPLRSSARLRKREPDGEVQQRSAAVSARPQKVQKIEPRKRKAPVPRRRLAEVVISNQERTEPLAPIEEETKDDAPTSPSTLGSSEEDAPSLYRASAPTISFKPAAEVTGKTVRTFTRYTHLGVQSEMNTLYSEWGLSTQSIARLVQQPSKYLENLYIALLGPGSRSGEAICSCSSIDLTAALIGAALSLWVFSAKLPWEKACGLFSTMTHEIAADARLRQLGSSLAEFTRETGLGALQDPEFEKRHIAPEAQSLAKRLSDVLQEHISAQSVFATPWFERHLHVMVQHELLNCFKHALSLKREFRAAEQMVDCVNVPPGADFDENTMHSAAGPTLEPDTCVQRQVSLTLFPGIKIRKGDRSVVAAKATVRVYSRLEEVPNSQESE